MPSRIGDYLRARGQIYADYASRQGDVSANLASSLGAIASHTAGQIASHVSPEAKAQRAEVARKAKLTTLMNDSDDLSPEQFIAKLRANGLHDEAMKMETARLDQIGKTIDVQVKQVGSPGTELEFAL